METKTVTAQDISCDHCKMTIEKSVGGLQGVKSVNVAVDPKQVTVQYDPDTISWDQIAATLDDEGYPAA